MLGSAAGWPFTPTPSSGQIRTPNRARGSGLADDLVSHRLHRLKLVHGYEGDALELTPRRWRPRRRRRAKAGAATK